MAFFQTVRSILSTHKHMDAWSRLKPTFKMFHNIDFPVDATNVDELERFCDHLTELCYRLIRHSEWKSTYNTPQMLGGFLVLACDDAKLPVEKITPIVGQKLRIYDLLEQANLS